MEITYIYCIWYCFLCLAPMHNKHILYLVLFFYVLHLCVNWTVSSLARHTESKRERERMGIRRHRERTSSVALLLPATIRTRIRANIGGNTLACRGVACRARSISVSYIYMVRDTLLWRGVSWRLLSCRRLLRTDRARGFMAVMARHDTTRKCVSAWFGIDLIPTIFIQKKMHINL